MREQTAGVDLPAIAHLNSIPRGTLRYWAHVNKWQPIGVDNRRRNLYDLKMVADFLATKLAA